MPDDSNVSPATGTGKARRLPEDAFVVAVGASAGGLEAFKELVDALPGDSGMVFLLVQHLDPNHESLLCELLEPRSSMPVRDAGQGVALEPDTIYVIRPDTSLAVRDDRIELSEPVLHRGVRLPVDHLFRSIAREYGARAAGIVLSGAGSDGSAGVRELRTLGGLTVAQLPETAGQMGMPQSAIATGAIDLILRIADMPAALERFRQLPPHARIAPLEQPDAAPGQPGSPPEQPGSPPEQPASAEAPPAREPTGLDAEAFQRLATLLEAHAEFDIRMYKRGTVERRVLRRMLLSGFDRLEPYLDLLRDDPEEQHLLLRDLLISVTEFFRDREPFAALRELVLEPLVATVRPGQTLRVWVPGCATGEEAYSIGVELMEATEAQGKRVQLQIFATDIDQHALAVAREATYPPSIDERIAEQRLSQYFTPVDKGYRVKASLRDVVTFAMHDITKDPPFSNMDLVSCRNLLIYLTPETQRYVFGALHFALAENSYLFLGTAESPGSRGDLFATLSKSSRVYRKVGTSRPVIPTRTRDKAPDPSAPRNQRAASPAEAPRPRNDLARRAALEAVAPPLLIVADDGRILFSHGDLAPYVHMPQGDHPRFEFSAVIRPEIAARTRGALYKCRRDGTPVVASVLQVAGASVEVEARPAPGLDEKAVLLIFRQTSTAPAAAPTRGSAAPGDAEQEQLVRRLEGELDATREDLRTTVEELETTNEELRSSSEEAMSMNEELQSANEELEATSEELRSLNEELTTVNQQLREKLEQLEQARDALDNFFSSTRIATLFLDETRRIKRFTPAAGTLLDLDSSDVGRRITDIARELLQDELAQDVDQVLEQLVPRSRELDDSRGRYFERKVLPYRTDTGRRIEGVVITWVEITELKWATERLGLRERQQRVIAELGLHALKEVDTESFMDRVVRDLKQTLDADFSKILELQPGDTRLLLRAGDGWQAGAVDSVLVEATGDGQAAYTLRVREPVSVVDLASETRFSGPPLLEEHGARSGLSCVVSSGDRPFGVVSVHARARRKFSSEDENFLQAVANVLGFAIARQQARQRVALELGVSRVLSNAENWDAALDEVLAVMAGELSASLVELCWAEDDGTLGCGRLHVTDEKDRVTATRDFPPRHLRGDEGLIGHVYQRARAAWSTDKGDPPLFGDAAQGAALGLRSGIALPVYRKGGVAGVVSLYCRHHLFADAGLLQSLEGIGRALGDFLTRAEYADRVRGLATILEMSQDATFAHRPDGTVTRWLPGAERLFGYSAEEMLGQPVELIVPEQGRAAFRALTERIIKGDKPDLFEASRRRKDGGTVTVSVLRTALRNATGMVVEVVSVERDLEPQKETERQLMQADRQKNMFLAMLSHELRNPVSAIRSATELLKLQEGDSHPALAMLERQSSHVSKLLGGLLDISRIISDKVELEKSVVDLRALCRDNFEDSTHQRGERDIDMQLELPREPVWVEADPHRISQVLGNLLCNAIKYTPDGGEAKLALSSDSTEATVTVSDTGIGFEADAIPHIFELFHQSDQNPDQAEGGLGLGLALAESLVDLHGGRIDAWSEGRGRGAQFIVSLPLTDKRPEAPAQEGPPPGALNILIVEDNPDGAEALRGLLAHEGHSVEVASDARGGLELARRFEPDVVLCDLGLPGELSGYDLAESLRGERFGPRCALIAVTGYAAPDDVRRCRDAGFDAHVTKPIDLAVLTDELRKVHARLGPAGDPQGG